MFPELILTGVVQNSLDKEIVTRIAVDGFQGKDKCLHSLKSIIILMYRARISKLQKIFTNN